MNEPVFSKTTYYFLFALLALVYVVGLFVPLMDNDSAHHANIALHMYLTGDFVSLIDHHGAYLDKPHLHFWLCAFSYKIFGVNTFAYKLPSFLFTVLGVYSTFRLGKLLYNEATGKLAALILASSFAFILANNDVRMDAILTACIAFSIWQLVAWMQNKKIIHVFGAALGLALGFCTKGHIAVFVPAVAVIFYLLYKKDWKILLHWQWLLMGLLFLLFISPVVYCYYLQFNRHPEVTVRGQDHINGVKFILLNQSIERFTGTMGSDAKHDYLFFIHSFLWAFAPWSVLAYMAIVKRVKEFVNRKEEWLTVGVFLTLLLVVSFSGFKLPHYLNIVFPTTAVVVASYLLKQKTNPTLLKNIFIIQTVISVILLAGLILINAWAFPVHSLIIMAVVVLLLSIVFYYFISKKSNGLQKSVGMSVAVMALSFFLLNSNFYPQLLTYQAGRPLALMTKGKVNPGDVFFWNNTYSSSYNYYSKSLHRQLTDSSLKPGEKKWLIFDIKSEEEILQKGYHIGQRYEAKDFEITQLDIKFINPQKREKECSRLVLAELSR
ncbi:MAG TPA: glycosyltransferase family 39 protein [Chitinophagaceae bacterium]|nr:glycosyltransferase family 39 protein [Chitinophagaceae bacterium]HMX76544.1 glycosyltransferase family 39 protein [Chitinophagaceae bacterium]HNA18690.1 glycosyltransferase family 39 protein [Chitinophagaceae bacterium]HND94471.1 glycosyltransferase family 39 protein [Chitinophagaceae bacterium]HNF37146.1 glycosyltransferase family 39 protein [Chitinophagaceae bacterium]